MDFEIEKKSENIFYSLNQIKKKFSEKIINNQTDQLSIYFKSIEYEKGET